MNDYKKLQVWREAMDLVSDVYRLTKKFQKEEMFGLTSQMRRCSVSIPSNIAEGAGRNGNKEFIHFLGITFGSCCELDTQLIIAERLGYIETYRYITCSKEIRVHPTYECEADAEPECEVDSR
jgi:four helix bundle protein